MIYLDFDVLKNSGQKGTADSRLSISSSVRCLRNICVIRSYVPVVPWYQGQKAVHRRQIPRMHELLLVPIWKFIKS